MSRSLKPVYDIIREVQATRGTNAKKEILYANSKNADLKSFLYLTYEPTKSYYQTKISPVAAPFVGDTKVFTSDVLDDIVNQLADRTITGNTAEFWLGGLAAGFEEDWGRELLGWLIARDVRGSIGTTAVNATWPGLVTDVPYMRCSLPKKVKLHEWPWAEGVASEIKYDGMYANVKITLKAGDVDIEFMSRNGSVLLKEAFPQTVINEIITVALGLAKDYPDENGFVLNGELEMLDSAGNLVPRKQSNGKFNSLIQKGEIPVGYTPQYKVWDFQPLSFFNARSFPLKRKYRVEQLEKAFANPYVQFRLVKLGEIKIVYSYAEAYEHFKAVRKLKLEGTIIKHPDGYWEDGTSVQQVKMKEEKTIELRVRDFNPGNGKNAATFGSLQCETEDGLLAVGVSGFTDDMRKWMSDNRDYMQDRVIAVVANDIMKPEVEGDLWSLFLPRFDEIRADRNEADTLDRVKAMFDLD